jgi:serine protease Do
MTHWLHVLQARLLLSSLVLSLGPGWVWADEAPREVLRQFQSALMETIARVEPSVVSVARVPTPPAPAGLPRRPLVPWEPRPQDAGFVPTDFGSGVIVSGPGGGDERFVLTMGHVVLGGSSRPAAIDPAAVTVLVRLASRHLLTAELVAADPRSDLAVLRLPLAAAGIPLEAAPPIELGDAAAVRKGQLVVALGNPYAIARDGSASASIGIVSNLSRKPWPPGGVLLDPTETNLTIHHFGTLLQVDTRLNLGTSGGAVVDLDGKLIGLATALAALEGYETSVGYAVPVDPPLRRIVASLCQGYEVEYGFLGIQPGDADAGMLREFRDLTPQATAARVRRIVPGSPADRCGLKTNDIVLAVQGVPVYSEVDLVREVGWLGPDVEAELSVLRPSERRLLTLACRLAKWPVYDDSLLVVTRERHPAWRGLHLDYPTARRRFLPANVLEQFPEGVVITMVDVGSPADAAGLQAGRFITQVENKVVSSPREFSEAVQGRTGPVLLRLSDGRTVRVPPE